MKRAILLVALAACGSRTPTTTLPARPAAKTSSRPASRVLPTANTHVLRRVERKIAIETLPNAPIPWDVELCGERDPALLAAIEGATRGWTHVSTSASPRGDRFLFVGSNAATVPAFVILDGAGKKLGGLVADGAFFDVEGEVVFRNGTQLSIFGDPPKPIGGPQSALCVDKTCGKRTVPMAATAGAAKVLVARVGSGFVHDEDVFVLDPITGATTTLFAPSKTSAFLNGALFADGRYCAYEMGYSKGDGEPSPATLECAAPPWTDVKKLLVREDGAPFIGEVGGRVVTGAGTKLDVLDASLTKRITYALPEGGGLPIALTDGRSVAIEGRDAIVLVDLVDEKYAVIGGVPTVVMPLVGHVKAFIATGDGTASVVRYE